MKISQMVLQKRWVQNQDLQGTGQTQLLRAGVYHSNGSGPISVGFGPGAKEVGTSGVVVDGFIDRRSRAKTLR